VVATSRNPLAIAPSGRGGRRRAAASPSRCFGRAGCREVDRRLDRVVHKVGQQELGGEREVAHYNPQTIAFLGKTAYQVMTGLRDLEWGNQVGAFGTARVWLLPNPSGLNSAFTLERLVEHYGG
jgi:G:T/U-mismatch repair DNA glycosylase